MTITSKSHTRNGKYSRRDTPDRLILSGIPSPTLGCEISSHTLPFLEFPIWLSQKQKSNTSWWARDVQFMSPTNSLNMPRDCRAESASWQSYRYMQWFSHCFTQYQIPSKHTFPRTKTFTSENNTQTSLLSQEETNHHIGHALLNRL